MKKPESNHAPALDAELISAISSKRDVFDMLRTVSVYLKAHADDIDADKKAASVLGMLKRAAKMPMLRAEYKALDGGAHIYTCEGSDADWLWICTDLEHFATWPFGYSAQELIQFCDNTLSAFRYGIPGEAERAVHILEGLEERFGYLSKVIGPNGLHSVSFPTIGTQGIGYDLECMRIPGGVRCCAQIPAVCADGSIEDQNKPVYLSAVAAILEASGIWDDIPASALDLLAHTTAPDIRSREPDDQRQALVDALLMGLSWQAPYGSFEEFRGIPCNIQMAWRDYIVRLINSLDAEGEED